MHKKTVTPESRKVPVSSKNHKPTAAAVPMEQNSITIGDVQVLAAMGELFNHVEQGLPMWSGNGNRSLEVKVTFARAFAETPIVTLSFCGLDAAHDQNLRCQLFAERISKTGFTIRFFTWSDTHIARASVTWSAIGKSRLNPVEAFGIAQIETAQATDT